MNIGQGFSLNPLSEVVSADDQKPLVPYYLGKGPDNVQALLSERPRIGQRIEGPSGLMNVRCESLTHVTLLYVFICFPLHV